jgi:hypothetical protein
VNVGTMTATAAADPVLSLPSSGTAGGAGSAARDAGGFAAALRDASGSTGGSAGDDNAAAATANSPAAEPDTGDAAAETDDAAEAAAAQLLVAWQRTTTTGLALTPTTPPGESASATVGLPAGEATTLPTDTLQTGPLQAGPLQTGALQAGTELPALVPQGEASPEATVLPETDAATDGPVLDLTGMEAVPETPLELGDPGADDLGSSTSGDQQASPDLASTGPDARQPAAGAVALANATSAPAAASSGAPTPAAAAAPSIEIAATEAPAVDPTASAASAATPATARADAFAAPTATIRADELQRAIADTARQLADQGGGRHRISVRITSPDLGQVVIEIVSRGSDVRVTLQPQDTGAGGSLQQQHQAVARALATEGFTLSGFDVQTGHPDGRGREDAPQPQGNRAIDDELDRIDLTATDDGALRL